VSFSLIPFIFFQEQIATLEKTKEELEDNVKSLSVELDNKVKALTEKLSDEKEQAKVNVIFPSLFFQSQHTSKIFFFTFSPIFSFISEQNRDLDKEDQRAPRRSSQRKRGSTGKYN
jgi:hypothetical protein